VDPEAVVMANAMSRGGLNALRAIVENVPWIDAKYHAATDLSRHADHGRGLALAAFGLMHMLTTEPLLEQLLRYVMSEFGDLADTGEELEMLAFAHGDRRSA